MSPLLLCLAMLAGAGTSNHAELAIEAQTPGAETPGAETLRGKPPEAQTLGSPTTDVTDAVAEIENPLSVPQSVSISVDIDENLGTEEPGPDNSSAEPIQPVFADLSDQEVFEKAKAYFGDLSTLTADFVQVAPSGGVSSGRLWLRRPRQLRMEYGEEKDPQLLIVATQGNVFVRDNDLETTDQYPIKSTPLGLILSKEGVSPSVEIVRVTRSENRVDVTVRDQDKDAEGELTLSLAAPDLALREWAVLDPQGGVTVVALENIVEGQSIANRLFRAPEAGGKFLNR